jgi:hypothetical protein
MLSLRAFLTGALAALLVAQVAAVDQTVNPQLGDEIKLAPTNYDKVNKLLPNDSDWTYDFTTNKFYTFAPGGVSNANAAIFPSPNYDRTRPDSCNSQSRPMLHASTSLPSEPPMWSSPSRVQPTRT